ncbi:endonuclease/exonuclease/phosphatase family protein (plasmid) [Qingshengfaniella alkalisoli]|uniref:Endonuclease/exonuclease/phosphatase family protein n=2 Tax=Qingshengfaniella alkalisoli TaxID=2599296 RepID=A0A5B8IYV1_9RHOB|nr:endonuclease/exonuclease/phosphatase family protein [Qingshengfaniella alkalisoli]
MFVAIGFVMVLFWGMAAPAQVIRVAQYNVELDRDGPGLLLRDILRDEDSKISAAQDVITRADPDVILLNRFDYDADLLALSAFADALAEYDLRYPHRFALPPNSGLATGLDLDGNERTGEPRDAQGYGRFHGQSGMAILSKWPIGTATDFSDFMWKNLPNARRPTRPDGTPFPSGDAQDIQRLSSVGHWLVPILINGTPLTLLAFHATPPVFDGPEDLNGLRNRDEIRFWPLLLDASLPYTPPAPPFVLLGTLNVDPDQGEGYRDTVRDLLAHPELQDPLALLGPTVDWTDLGLGLMRVDYILPSGNLRVTETGTVVAESTDASRHKLIWVDMAISVGE